MEHFSSILLSHAPESLPVKEGGNGRGFIRGVVKGGRDLYEGWAWPYKRDDYCNSFVKASHLIMFHTISTYYLYYRDAF